MGSAQRPVSVSLPPQNGLGALEEAGDPSARMQQRQREKWAMAMEEGGPTKEREVSPGLGSRGAENGIHKGRYNSIFRVLFL